MAVPRPPSRPRVRWRHRRDLFSDMYYALLTIGWPTFVVSVGLLFLGMNAVFALAYTAQPGAIVHARAGSFADAFFFSVQTMATIGYGIMYPGTFYANVLMTLETLVGLFGLALATGLAFARFSRPRARILFSRFAVVTRYHGAPTLMFRVANQRGNQILEARVQAVLLRNEQSPEGHDMRRFHDLVLARQRTPTFTYSWTVMHTITPESPLWETDTARLQARDAEIVVILSGLDETLSQTIHARHVYRPEQIQWGQRLRDILSKNTVGEYWVDYSHFDDIVGED
ncbi:MAG: ion channel [Acidiferrobacter sp.]